MMSEKLPESRSRKYMHESRVRRRACISCREKYLIRESYFSPKYLVISRKYVVRDIMR